MRSFASFASSSSQHQRFDDPNQCMDHKLKSLIGTVEEHAEPPETGPSGEIAVHECAMLI